MNKNSKVYKNFVSQIEVDKNKLTTDQLKSRLLTMDIQVDQIKKPKKYYVDMYTDAVKKNSNLMSLFEEYGDNTNNTNTNNNTINNNNNNTTNLNSNTKRQIINKSDTKVVTQNIFLNRKRGNTTNNTTSNTEPENTTINTTNLTHANTANIRSSNKNLLGVLNSSNNRHIITAEVKSAYGGRSSRQLVNLDDLPVSSAYTNTNNNSSSYCIFANLKSYFFSENSNCPIATAVICPLKEIDYCSVIKVITGSLVVFGTSYYVYKYNSINLYGDLVQALTSLANTEPYSNIISSITNNLPSGQHALAGACIIGVLFVLIYYINQRQLYQEKIREITSKCYDETIKYFEYRQENESTVIDLVEEFNEIMLEESALVSILSSSYEMKDNNFLREVYTPYLRMKLIEHERLKLVVVENDESNEKTSYWMWTN